MKLTKRALLLLVVLGFACGPADAERKLSDFNGLWQGGGSDRNTPFEPMQHTSCRASITADLRRMTSNIECNGAVGLTKVIRLRITLSGNNFTGDLTQSARTRGGNAVPTVLTGSVSGRKTDTTASFRVSFPGLTPSVDVVLISVSSSVFSMQANTLGGQLMSVTFNRTH